MTMADIDTDVQVGEDSWSREERLSRREDLEARLSELERAGKEAEIRLTALEQDQLNLRDEASGMRRSVAWIGETLKLAATGPALMNGQQFGGGVHLRP